MLQAVHHKKAAPRASSIYCRWIRESRGEQVHLVAVWIDSAMRCFERKLLANSEVETTHPSAVEEPGGVAFLPSPGRAIHEIKK